MPKKCLWLAGLVVFAVACGGDGEKADYHPPVAVPGETSNVEGLNVAPPGGELNPQGDPNSGETKVVKFVVKENDSFFYAAEKVSDIPYSGTIEGIGPGGGRSVKVYQNGVLKWIDEYFQGALQKKSTTFYDFAGKVVKKEEWREDGSKVVATSQVPTNKVGRNIKWEEGSLNLYEGKPTSTILTVFGLPDDRKVFDFATSYSEDWTYKNIKVVDFEKKLTLKTVKFKIEKKKCTSVIVN